VNLPFSPIDAAITALVGYAVWNGYRSGFITTAYGLATWILSFVAAVLFQGQAALLIERLGLVPAMARPIAFVAVIIVVQGLLSVAGHFALTPIVKSVHRLSPWAQTVDKVLGVLPSAVRSMFILGVVLAAMVVSPLPTDLKAAIESSRLARGLIERVSAVQPQLAALTGGLGDNVPLFVTKLGAEESERLDVPDRLTLVTDAAAERQMFDLVNEERVGAGLNPLEWDDRLVPVARAHCEEMFRLKYFSHHSPVSGSPFDRIKAAGIAYSRAGENLAYAQSVTIAHRGLMQSQGHRENILRPEFTRMAVGVISAGLYGRMFTQLFITP
jgi:uncharacterized protein YkwD/uncharacterized membrane protein required for colicin V production